METAKSVLVINIHGGFPSCMIKKAFEQLPSLHELFTQSEVYSSCYPTNMCKASSLHDIIMDAPLASMTDDSKFDWSRVRHATRSLFSVFQQRGYVTSLFGEYDIDASFDDKLTKTDALASIGIDTFVCNDKLPASATDDEETVCRLCASLHVRDKARPFFMMINLAGCQDVQMCTINDSTVECSSHNSYSMLPESVIDDNPRDTASVASQITGIQRGVMMRDWLMGDTSCAEDSLDFSVKLHRLAWKCLLHMDTFIQKMLNALKQTNCIDDTMIYMTCDHPCGLFEHGALGAAPWDTCLKTFLTIYNPNRKIHEHFEDPCTLAYLPQRILKDCGICIEWHVQVRQHSPITIGICPSWLSRSYLMPPIDMLDMRVFLIRLVTQLRDRVYSVRCWFSLRDLILCTNPTHKDLSNADMLLVCGRTMEWRNPVLETPLHESTAQVYDISTDPNELYDCVNTAWLSSTVPELLKVKLDEAIRDFGYDVLRIRFPIATESLSLDTVSGSQAATHLRQKCQNIIKMPDVACQTVNCVIDTELINRIGRGYTRSVMKMYDLSLPLTLFASRIHSEWVAWLPHPILGAFSYDALQRICDSKQDIKNIHGEAVHLDSLSRLTIGRCVLSGDCMFLERGNEHIVLHFVEEKTTESAIVEKRRHNTAHESSQKSVVHNTGVPIVSNEYQSKNSSDVLLNTSDNEASQKRTSQNPPEDVDVQSTKLHIQLANVKYDRTMYASIHPLNSDDLDSETRAPDSPTSEMSGTSEKARRLTSRSDLSRNVRRVDSFSARSKTSTTKQTKIQPNIPRGSVKTMELGKHAKESFR